ALVIGRWSLKNWVQNCWPSDLLDPGLRFWILESALEFLNKSARLSPIQNLDFDGKDRSGDARRRLRNRVSIFPLNPDLLKSQRTNIPIRKSGYQRLGQLFDWNPG